MEALAAMHCPLELPPCPQGKHFFHVHFVVGVFHISLWILQRFAGSLSILLRVQVFMNFQKFLSLLTFNFVPLTSEGHEVTSLSLLRLTAWPRLPLNLDKIMWAPEKSICIC